MNTRQYKLRKLSKKKEVVPEYSFGGWLKEHFTSNQGNAHPNAGKPIEEQGKLGRWLSGGGAGDVINKVYNAGSYALDTVMPGTGQLMRGIQQRNLSKEEASQEELLSNSGGVAINPGSSFNNYRDMWTASMGGVVPSNKKANSKVRNNFMRPNTDKEIGLELLNRGFLGNVTDTTATLNKWNALHWNDKKAFIDTLGKDSGISYTTGKGTKTANPGGVAYWIKESLDTSNPRTVKSINKNTSYPQYAMGGVVPNGMPNVSLEKNEVTMGPDGSMKTRNLPSHPNSNRESLAPGTVVFSDNPKLRMPNGLTPAQNADEHKKAKASAKKVLDNPNSTILSRRTAERKMSNADKQLSDILDFQLSKTQNTTNNINADGTQVTTLGDIIGKASTFLGSDKGKNLLNTAGQLAPIFYNMNRAGQQVEMLNPASFQNPMAYDALQSMRGRQVDTGSMLTNNAESAAIAEANLRNSGAGVGAYRAGITGIQNARMKANSAVLNQADIQNNAYLGEYGQMQSGIGQRMADTNLMISDLNARNEAAGRNYGAAASGQASQFFQIQQQMNNQKQRDQMLMPMYQSWLEQMSGKVNKNSGGYTPSVVNTNIAIPSAYKFKPTWTGMTPTPAYPIDSYANQMAGR